jgi:hypothetical protein
MGPDLDIEAIPPDVELKDRLASHQIADALLRGAGVAKPYIR